MAFNCYGYALRVDKTLTPGTRYGKKSKVYKWSQGFDKYPFIDSQTEVLFDACIADGLQVSGNLGKEIALFVHAYDDCIDYHFYRQDNNGSWSYKDSVDGDIVKGIRDPEDYDEKLVGKQLETGVLKGQKYAGLLYLPSWDNMQLGWDGD